MIIKSLVDHYDLLDHDICSIDFDWKRPDLRIEIDDDGIPINYELDPKKDWKEVRLPNESGRTRNPIGERLYDKAKYVFGCELSDKSKAQYEEEYRAFRDRNLDLIKDIDTPTANAFRKFLKIPMDDPVMKDLIQDLKANKDAKGNIIVFAHKGKLIQDDQEIWDRLCRVQEEERNIPTSAEPEMLSIISGEPETIARKHPKIKGVSRDASSLISYNFDSVEKGSRSGVTQSLNSRIGKTDSLKYTKTLNYLIDTRGIRIGDMMIIAYSNSPKADEIFRNLVISPLQNPKEALENLAQQNDNPEDDIENIVKNIIDGKPVDIDLDSYTGEFHVIGMSVNIKGRIAINFSYEGKFGDLIKNIEEYYQQTALANVWGDVKHLFPSQMHLLMSQGPLLSGKSPEDSRKQNREVETRKLSKSTQSQVMMSFLTGRKFPESLMKQAVNSMPFPQKYDDKAMQTLYDQRVMAKLQYIKAYLLRNTNMFKGENLVSLNTETNNPAYLMGRIFAIIESTESKSDVNPYNRYYKMARTSPAAAQSLMLEKMRMRLSHDKEKLGIYNRAMYQISEILGKIEGVELPTKLSLNEKGSWDLGYFAQRTQNIQDAIEKKKLNEAANADAAEEGEEDD